MGHPIAVDAETTQRCRRRLDDGDICGSALERRQVDSQPRQRAARRSGVELPGESLDELETGLECLPRVDFAPLVCRWPLEDTARDAERCRAARIGADTP